MKTMFQDTPNININIDGQLVKYTDYFKFVDVNELHLNTYDNYITCQIHDGERPDQLSHRLYETTDFYWTFFIVNDILKNGMIEWPLSNQALEKHIADTYEPYGVCELKPIPDEEYLETCGLDLSYPNLRVYRNENGIPADENLSKIHKFDDATSQLWIKDNRDRNFYATRVTSSIRVVLVNPYVSGTSEHIEAESSNLEWLREASVKWYPFYNETFEFNDENIQEEIEDKMLFNVRTFYEMSQNAPKYYYNVITDKRIPNLTAQVEMSGEAKTFYEYEKDKNTHKSNIKVLNSNVVHAFVTEYNRIINRSERLTLE